MVAYSNDSHAYEPANSMSTQLPTALVPTLPAPWRTRDQDYSQWPWEELPSLPSFVLADGSAPAQQQTHVRIAFDSDNFYVRFDCDDTDIWAEATARDSHIYDEEVVELFIAPGEAHPTHYYEFEVSPIGTLLDLDVHSPDLERRTLRANFAWNCPGLQWSAERNDAANHWRAYLVVPWRSIGGSVGAGGVVPQDWRANFYRIERPHGQPPEFSCWSPTMSDPADYHRPAYFGYLRLAAS
jgi:hypothetical protein